MTMDRGYEEMLGGDDPQAALRRHLGTCPECAATATRLRGMRPAGTHPEVPPAPPDLTDRIMARLTRVRQETASPGRRLGDTAPSPVGPDGTAAGHPPPAQHPLPGQPCPNGALRRLRPRGSAPRSTSAEGPHLRIPRLDRGLAPVALALAAALVLLATHLTSRSGGPGITEVEAYAPPVVVDVAGAVHQGIPSGDCVGVPMAVSTEKSDLLGLLAAEYDRRHPTVDGRCVDVRVFGKESGGVEQALARGWDQGRDGGPPPVVWSPASSAWLDLLGQAPTAPGRPRIVAVSRGSLCQSPLVIAMPEPMARALGWPDRPIGWGDLLALAGDPGGWARYGHPEWGQFRLGKTDPDLSTSGLNALVGTYFAATGGDLSPERVADPEVRSRVATLERSVDHYGDTEMTFLGNLQAADDRGTALQYISAVAVEEKSVWDYDQGNPSGDPASLGHHAPPRVPLVAIYPREGTLVSDSPYAVLDAPWVSSEQRRAAEGFLRFLREDAQQRRFTDLAFRDAHGRAGGRAAHDPRLVDRVPRLLSPPAPPVLAHIQADWQNLRKRAQVLIEIDVSSAMGEPVPGSGTTRLGLVKRAVRSTLDEFTDADDVAVWASSTSPTGRLLHVPLVDMGPLEGRRGEIQARVDGLSPGGTASLESVVRQDAGWMQEHYDRSRINAVLLLSGGGDDHLGSAALDGLVGELRGRAAEGGVRVFSIAYGRDADLTALGLISQASRAAVYKAQDPATIDRVFTAVISNF
jgi:Ca-activated chloride channel homolog